MFNKLVASDGKKKAWNFKTATASLVIHVALLGGAVYASVQAPKAAKKAEELVTFLELEEKQPEPPKVEEPPPPPDKPVVNTPPPPKGFQELVPPKEPPPVIPDVDTSAPAVDPRDFTGVGQAGGSHKGVEGGTPQSTAPVDSANFAYEVAVLEKAPELINKSQVASMLSRFYPRMLQDAGIGGQTMMQFVITAQGTVDESTVKVIQSTHEQFGEASTKVVEKFRFRPGRYKGQPVRVLIQMPITWQPQS